MFTPAHELVVAAKKSVTEYNAADIQARMALPNCLIIDVREPDEYAQGCLPGALNIPRGMLEFRLSGDPALQDLQRPIIVYCKTSGRAALSVVAMQQMGFANVVSLAGGFDAWAAEGLPQSKPQSLSFE